MDYDVAHSIVLIINSFMCLSSPLNLAVYCGMSNQFREKLTKIMAEVMRSLVSVQLTAFTRQSSSVVILKTRETRVTRRPVVPECPYLAGNKRFCRGETMETSVV